MHISCIIFNAKFNFSVATASEEFICPHNEHFAATVEADSRPSFEFEHFLTIVKTEPGLSDLNDAASNAESEFLPSETSKSSSAEEYLLEKVHNKRKNMYSGNKSESKKRQTQKSLRNSGLPYVSYTKKVVPGKYIRRECDERCRFRCKELFAESRRLEIFNNYWGYSDLQLQREFIANHTKEIKPKYRYSCTNNYRKLNNAFFFEINSELTRVCKSFFKATLDINNKVIQTAIEKKEKHNFLDLRGRHSNHPKVSNDIKNSIRDFLKYKSTKNAELCMANEKNISKLYRAYKESCIAKNSEAGSKYMFNKVFKTEFSHGLGKQQRKV